MGKGVKWTWQGALGPLAIPTRAPPGPQVALPRHQSMGAPPEAMTSVHSMMVWWMAEIGWPWIHGPIVIHSGASNRLTNRLPNRILTCVASKTTIGSQLEPDDQEAVHPRAGRHPLAPPDALDAPPTSWLPTSTPSLYTINRGCGAQWRSAPFNSKLSKLLLAF
jgi:hypothetical protein